MRRLLFFLCLSGATALAAAGNADPAAPYKDPAADIEVRVSDLMSRMTPEEMADLLAANYWTTNENPRLGIPRLQMVNGSFGPLHHLSTAFPTSVNLAASFNRDLVREVGVAIGKEARAKGDNTLLGPVIYMHRLPQAGRNAESYSEDPYLAGQMAVEHIRGIQSQGVITTAALFGCKTHEYHSKIYDVKADPRTIHEIYLPAYKAAVQDGGTWSIMTAYNRVNGTYVSNHTQLLTDIIKNKWGFKGFIMTDWAGVQNFQEALYAGLDLDMSNARTFNRGNMLPVLRGDRGPLYRDKARDKVRRLLRAMFAMGLFERKEEKIEVNVSEHQALALQVARESIVLLKNEGNLLPLDRRRLRSIAVIGPNAAIARTGIGGASRVPPYRTVSPLEGVGAAVGGPFGSSMPKGVTCEIEASCSAGSTLPRLTARRASRSSTSTTGISMECPSRPNSFLTSISCG